MNVRLAEDELESWLPGEVALLLQALDAAPMSASAQCAAYRAGAARDRVALQRAVVMRSDVCADVAALAATAAHEAVRVAWCVNPATDPDQVRAALGTAPTSQLLTALVRAGGWGPSSPIADAVVARLRTKPTLGLARAVISSQCYLTDAVGLALQVAGTPPATDASERTRRVVGVAARDAGTAQWLVDEIVSSGGPVPVWVSAVAASLVLPGDALLRLVTFALPPLVRSVRANRPAARAECASLMIALAAHGQTLDPRVRAFVAQTVKGRDARAVGVALHAFGQSASAPARDLFAEVAWTAPQADIDTALSVVSTAEELWAWEREFLLHPGRVDVLVGAARWSLPTEVKVEIARSLYEADALAFQRFMAALRGDDAAVLELYAFDMEFATVDRFASFTSVEAGLRLLIGLCADGQMPLWRLHRWFRAIAQVFPDGHDALLDAPWAVFADVLNDPFSNTSAMCARLLATATEQAFADNVRARETFVTMSHEFTGSARELLTVSAAV